MKVLGKTWIRYLFTALVSSVLGLCIGGIVGGKYSSDIAMRIMRPSLSSAGDQARNVLVLLEKGDIENVKKLLEAEIDSTLEFLRHVQANDGFINGSPEKKVLERLEQYRDTHPR